MKAAQLALGPSRSFTSPPIGFHEAPPLQAFTLLERPSLLHPCCPFIHPPLQAFTLLEHPSLCTLYLMGCVFEQVLVTKPSPSKPGNSETYLIGKGGWGGRVGVSTGMGPLGARGAAGPAAYCPTAGACAALTSSCTP